MERYLAERSMLFNAWSEFSCPDSCERFGCKEPNLHISVSVVDLVAISLISGCKAPYLFKDDFKIGFDPLCEEDPWIGRISLELKKPCLFLDEKECSVYPGRPIACALFPEYCFMVENREFFLKKDIFRKFPCIQNPCFISPRRREALQQLFEMSIKEFFLSDFYLFGISPFVLDIKSVAGECLEGIDLSEERRVNLSHQRIENLVLKSLSKGGYLDDGLNKIERLDRAEGWDDLSKMKLWTDQMVMNATSLSIAYQFDGKRLLPIRLNK